MNCENGELIQVQSARYGLGSCWGDVTHTLGRICNSRTNCATIATNSIFSDPCRGDVKVFEAEYFCGIFDFVIFFEPSQLIEIYQIRSRYIL